MVCPAKRLIISIQSRLRVVPLLILMCNAAGWAAPAAPIDFQLQQPDGAVFTAQQGGDEWFNWVAVDKHVVGQAADGTWRYVQLTPTGTKFSSARAGKDPPPLDAVSDVQYAAIQPSRSFGAPKKGPVPPVRAPSGSTEPMLVLLVSFADRSINTSVASWQDLFFGTSGKTVRTYYDEVSKSGFHFVPAAESQGAGNDGIVEVTLGYSHPNTGANMTDANRQVVKDALNAANGYVNFSGFDRNADHGLSNNELHVVTILAGYEHAYGYACGNTPSVWGHRWSLGWTVAAPVLDGVAVSDSAFGGGYTQQGEWHCEHQAVIGLLCHELGHDIGLPDLYDTDAGNGSSQGIGVFSVMAGGSWGKSSSDAYQGMSPVHPDAWSKLAMGFLTPTMAAANGSYTLYQTGGGTHNVVRINTNDLNQYFLIENRQLNGFDTGMYQQFLITGGGAAGGGLAVWHIDTSVTSHYPAANDVNADAMHKGVDLEEANQGAVGASELDTNANGGNRQQLFYLGNQTHFGDATIPSSRLYNGSATNIDLANVSASGAAMSCYVSLSGPGTGPTPTPPPVPTATRTAAVVAPTATLLPGCQLISQGKPATASSAYSADYGPEKAVDGAVGHDLDRWVTSGEQYHWLVVDLGAPYALCEAHVYSDEAYIFPPGDGNLIWNVTSYHLRASNTNTGDPASWLELASYNNACGPPYPDYPGEGGSAHNEHALAGIYRYVALHIDAGDGDCGPMSRIQEFQIYGSVAQASPTPLPSITPVPSLMSTRAPTTMPVLTNTATPLCQGDADHNKFVNGDDFRMVRDHFGTGTCNFGDANGDCFVNGDDFRAVRDNFGRGCP